MNNEVARLLRRGLSNADVARAVGLSRERVRQLRREAGMPAWREARWREVLALIEAGCSRGAIARRLGVKDVRTMLQTMRRRGLLTPAHEALLARWR